MSKLQFSPVQDFTTIPYLPLGADKPAELRFQIKNTAQTPVKGQICLAENENILWKEENIVFQPGSYFFHKLSATFPMGEHTLTFRWKADDEAEFQEETLVLTVGEANQPLLTGGFVTLTGSEVHCTPPLEDQTEEQWIQFADAMNDMGAKMLIIFASMERADKRDPDSPILANYPSNILPKKQMPCDPIGTLIKAAEKNGQQVMIGFAHPLVHTPDIVGAVMEELFAMYGKSPAFYGWYRSYEINMGRHFEEELWAKWKKEWVLIKETATRLSPVKVIMTSPFCINERGTAEMTDKFLHILRTGEFDVDVIMPQDMNGHVLTGPGRGYFPPTESGKMFRILEPLCREGGVHLWANCESFDSRDDVRGLFPRYKNGGMHGELGFLQQIKEAAPYTEKVLTFCLTGLFASPKQDVKIGGDPAVKQYEEYMAYRNEYLK